MISIIICSRKKDISQKLYQNISETIGVPFEVMCIDNSKNDYSMCSAYNEGVKRAKYPFLCFMHEDATFLSKEWGKECVKEFEDIDVWMLGVLGTKYMNAMLAYWYPSPYLAGHDMKKNGELSSLDHLNESQDVVAVDGMWICMRRETFESGLKWDEETFRRFDMYDMDMSMQVVNSRKKIRTVRNIDIYHASEGNFSDAFYEESIKFHDKWDSILPVASFPITPDVERFVQRYLLERLSKFEKENRNRIRKLEKWPLSLLYGIYKKTMK